MIARFSRFAAIDWSGARGGQHPGIAVAVCGTGVGAPVLVLPPGRHWSRTAVLDWITAQGGNVLIGFDFSFAPPFLTDNAYLSGDVVADHARGFWAHVDGLCDDVDLGAGSLLEQHHRRHFYFGAADGPKAPFMRLRSCEAHYNAGGGGKPSSVFDAIGAAQVAKASFAGMRLLAHLPPHVPVWPFDPKPDAGPLVVEIYTRIAARAAGVTGVRTKIRDAAGLDSALLALGSDPHRSLVRYTDHVTDALVTSAWLRRVADDPALWSPPALTPAIAATEGWTFGVV